MLATQVILFATLIGNALLFAVVLGERDFELKRAFAAYVLCIFTWTLAIYLNLHLQSLWVEEWVFASAAGVLTLQLRFSFLFPNERKRARWMDAFVLSVGSAFILLSFWPGALFTTIVVHPDGYTIIDTGPFSAAYSLFAITFVCAPIAVLLRTYKAERRQAARTQVRYLMVGFTAFAVVAVLANSVLPVFFGIYDLNAIGPLFSMAFAGAILYLLQARKNSRDVEREVEERTHEIQRMHANEQQMMLEIAHGLQTPLTIFRAQLEQEMRSSARPDGDPLQRSLMTLTSFVHDLLKLAHVERPVIGISETVSVSELVQDLCEEVRVIASQHGLTLTADISPGCWATLDAVDMRSALLNILSNAIKYTHRGGAIVVSVRQSGSAITVSVRDTGIGIPAEDLPHIFDRFYRSRMTGRDGNGLGLAITKAAIERCGGTISASSTFGEGTLVTVSLPSTSGDDAAPQTALAAVQDE